MTPEGAPEVIWQRALHPGVVLAGTDPPDGPPLAVAALDLEEIAGVCSVLATTVADLHDVGIATGGVRGDSVVIGPDGRPVVVDLSRAAPFDRRVSHASALTELHALGSLLAATVERCAPGGLPDRRRWRWPRRRPRSVAECLAESIAGAERGGMTLRQFADGLAHHDARLPRRPGKIELTTQGAPPANVGPEQITDRVLGDEREPGVASMVDTRPEAISDQILDRAAGAAAGGDPGARRGGNHRVLHAWPLKLVGAGFAVSGVALMAWGLTAVLWGAPRPERTGTEPRPVGAGPGTPISLCLVTVSSGSCLSPATYQNGILRTPSARFAIGQPGDVIATGRWTCGATATVTLLRPASGEVWTFPVWPATAAEPVTGRLIAHVAGGRGLSARNGGSCDSLVVDRAGAAPVVLDRGVFS